jgi:hypothetical protein
VLLLLPALPLPPSVVRCAEGLPGAAVSLGLQEFLRGASPPSALRCRTAATGPPFSSALVDVAGSFSRRSGIGRQTAPGAAGLPGRTVSGAEAVAATVTCPNGSVLQLPVCLDEGAGRFRAALVCEEAGGHKVAATFNGELLPGCPFSVQCVPGEVGGATVCDWPGVRPAPARTVRVRDATGCRCSSLCDASLECRGLAQVDISCCHVEATCLATAGQPASFAITARDARGNLVAGCSRLLLAIECQGELAGMLLLPCQSSLYHAGGVGLPTSPGKIASELRVKPLPTRRTGTCDVYVLSTLQARSSAVS